MKRTVLLVTLIFCAAVLVSAQGNNCCRQGSFRQGFFPGGPRPQAWGYGSPRNSTPSSSPEKASVSGNLTIAQGMIAVTSGDITWLARGLDRYVGFIDGLKEGAQVTLEGYARPGPPNNKIKSLHVQKMTLNGKDYDLAQPRQNNDRGRMYQQNQRGRW